MDEASSLLLYLSISTYAYMWRERCATDAGQLATTRLLLRYIYVYICIYLYLYIYRYRHLSISIYAYIYA